MAPQKQRGKMKEKETVWMEREQVFVEVKGEWVPCYDGNGSTFVAAAEDPVPRLYYDEARSVLLTASCAFAVGNLLASARQARLWCEYHGFRLVLARVVQGLAGKASCVQGYPLRGAGTLRYADYAMHCLRCPDCQRAIRRGQWE